MRYGTKKGKLIRTLLMCVCMIILLFMVGNQKSSTVKAKFRKLNDEILIDEPMPTVYFPYVRKALTGDIPSDLEFTFLMRALDNNPPGVNLKPGEKTTTTIPTGNGRGDGHFPELTFTKAGIFEFEIYEKNNSVQGYTYDGKVWTLTVTVTEEASVLVARATYTDQNGTVGTEADFINDYNIAQVGYTPMVRKEIDGDAVSEDTDFTYAITFLDGTPEGAIMPEATNVTKAGVGITAFEEITFTKAGAYHFMIEEIPSNVSGYIYDTDTWTLTVEITDINGVLGQTATYTNNDNGEVRKGMAVFENYYESAPAPSPTEEPTTESSPDDTSTEDSSTQEVVSSTEEGSTQEVIPSTEEGSTQEVVPSTENSSTQETISSTEANSNHEVIPPSDHTASTGDDRNVALLVTVMAVSFVVIVVILLLREKEQK